MIIFFAAGDQRHQDSFPTRRSSDLCGGGNECVSGNCVDGVCCATAMCGTCQACNLAPAGTCVLVPAGSMDDSCPVDRKSTRLNSSHMSISYAVFCLKKKNVLGVEAS